MIKYRFFLHIFLLLIFTHKNGLAFSFKKPSTDTNSESPVVLKADNVDGDKTTNVVTATGHVEATRDNAVLTSDSISYNKDEGLLTAQGNVRVKDLEAGKMRAKEAKIKSDFSSGYFLNTSMIFSDGSYLTTARADRKTPEVTVLQRPVFSLCPDKEINRNNDLVGTKRDVISIKSSEATIDREKQVVNAKHAFLRIYNVPVLYTPYLQFPLPDNKRRSGFLTPSYIKNNRFGLGILAPYFVDIAPNADLTISPKLYLAKSQFTVVNEFRHLTSYGQYNLNLEISNNVAIANTDKLVIDRTKKAYRWLTTGASKLDLTTNSHVEYNINTASDRNYLRDYNYSFLAFTVSDAHYDYTKDREYFGVKTVRVQELVDVTKEGEAPLVLPAINHYIESKPGALKEKYALSSNFTAISRYSGLQYRRASFTPEVKLPINLHGNLISLNARVQTDLYSLENNYQYQDASLAASKYDSIVSNYKPEFAATWRLPLIQKAKANTLMIEPIVSFVSSNMQKSFLKLPDEDSNNSELTVTNLFNNNRIAGYDRNETGERFSYGAKTSMFNKYGQFGLTLGQSYRISSRSQDVTIRGFNNNNKSNLIGELSYKIPKYFNAVYSFQLSESNYRNEVNSLYSDLTLRYVTISGNYLLLRRNNSNAQEISQGGGSFGVKVTPKLLVSLTAAHDFVLQRTISRGITFDYGGCCLILNFSVKENNSINLTQPQTSYQINVLVRGF